MSKSIIGTLKFQKPEADGFDHVAFGDEIEKSVLRNKSDKAFKKKETFSPSTVGYGHGNCARYWYIAFEGAEFTDTFTSQGLANMENGTLAHKRIDGYLEGTGRLVESEVEVKSEDPPIRGYIDAILNWNGEKVIGEVKTAKQEVYDQRRASMKPSSNHLLQLLIYMKLTKSRQGVFIYENKNTQELCLIPITVNAKYIEIIDELFAWLRETRAAWEQKSLPNRAFTKSKPACKGCPVFDTCWNKLENGDNIIRAYEPPK